MKALNTSDVKDPGTKRLLEQTNAENKLTDKKITGLIKKYATGWINRSDWTNVHMGSDKTLNVDSNVAHGLDAPLSELIAKIFISADGTDANSFEVALTPSYPNAWCGYTVFNVDANNIKIQTGVSGILYLLDATGIGAVVTTQNWYYKIIVYKITPGG